MRGVNIQPTVIVQGHSPRVCTHLKLLINNGNIQNALGDLITLRLLGHYSKMT